MSIVYATALALSLFFHMVLSPVASALLDTCYTAYTQFYTCHSSHPPLDPLLHLPRTLLTFVYSCILPTSSQHSHTTTCTSTHTTLSTSPPTCTFYLSAHLSSTHTTSTTPVSMLIDTGAAVTLMNKQFLQTLSLQGTHLSPPPASTKLVSATGSTIDILGSLELSVTLPHNVVLPLSTLVVSDITESFILGVDSLQAHSVTLSFCTSPTFSVHDHTYPLTHHASASTCMSHAHPSASINDAPNRIPQSPPPHPSYPPPPPPNCSSIADKFTWTDFSGTPEDKVSLVSLLSKFPEVIAQHDKDIGTTDIFTHDITLTQSAPVRQAARRLSPTKSAIVKTLIDDMLTHDIIEPSTSPYASPIVLVDKPDGSHRFCVDYRKLNGITQKDAYPLPRIDDTLDALHGCTHFSTLDLQSGYWQVPMSPRSKPYTAFITSQGLFQFKRMPFGLSNAPATFQRLMNTALHGLLHIHCLIYLDDIIIFGKSRKEHDHNLHLVLSRLRSAGLKIKPSKCRLLCSKIKYLGHIISPAGVQPDGAKVARLESWPVPTSTKELHSFLGFAGYYRRFVQNYTAIARPLQLLIKQTTPFHWTTEHQKAFDTLRTSILTTSLLQYPDFNKPFILDTDASIHALGAVLSQIDSHGRERPVAFASRATTKAEQNYHTTRLEMLGIVWAIEHFRHYLLHAPFTLRTDHGALTWLHSFKSPSGQVARWLERLADFNYIITHRPGKSHNNADSLSRYPHKPQSNPSPTLPVTAITFTDTPFARHTWQHAQSQDPDISTVITRIQHGTPSFSSTDSPTVRALLKHPDQLVITDGILYSRTKGFPQLIVPHAMRTPLIHDAHAPPTSGHMGPQRTHLRLTPHYFWPGMKAEVTKYCTHCLECQQNKHKNASARAPLHHITATRPFQVIAIDLMGPLTRSADGNLYIVAVIDYFTKWLEIFPLKNAQTTTIAECLATHVFTRHGLPEQIHTDQGPQFESELFQELCHTMHIHKTRTTPYHPQSDGLVERSNRTVQNILKAYVNTDQTDWDRHLPTTMLAYNTSTHSTTGYTPHYLLYGFEAFMPLHIMYPLPQPHQPKLLTQFVSDFHNRLQTAFTTVRQRTGQSHTQTSARYDQSARAKPFSLHDFVWLHAHPPPHVSPKLFKHWTGPWKIVDTPSPVTYTITAQFPTTPHMQRITTVHRNRLRLYRTPVDYTPPPLLPTPLTAPTPNNDPPAINRTRTRNVKPPSYFGSPVLQINMSSSRSLTKQYHSPPHSKPPLLPSPPGRRPLLPRPPGNRPLLPRPTPSRTPPRVRKTTPPPRPPPPKFPTKATPCRSISPPPPTSASPIPDPGVTDLLTLYDSDDELLVG